MTDSASKWVSGDEAGPQLEQLRQRVSLLEQRLQGVEARVGAPARAHSEAAQSARPGASTWAPASGSRGGAASASSAPALAAERAVSSAPATAMPKARPQGLEGAVPQGSGWKLPSPEWEALIGGKWALWAGAASLFLALAMFLAYTWQSLPPAPPWVRVAMGVAGGVALLGAGGWARGRTQKWFSDGISGAGLAVLYLSIWAGAQYFHLIPLTIAFAAMAAVTAVGVALALRLDAPGLSVLATLGGFCTPMLLQPGSASAGGGASGASLLLYAAILDGGILAASLSKRWRGITWLALGATMLLIGGWLAQSGSATPRWIVLSFVSLYWLAFSGAACFYSLRRGESTARADLLLLFASALAYAASLALLAPAPTNFPGAFPLTLAAAYALLSQAVRSLAPQNRTLREGAVGLALLFLTVAVGVQLRHSALVTGWAGEAGVLLILAHRRESVLLRRAGQTVWALAGCLLLGQLSGVTSKLSSGQDALAMGGFVAATLAVAWQLHRSELRGQVLADELSSLYPVASVAGGAWLAARGAWSLAHHIAVPSGLTREGATLLLVAVALSFYASAAMWAGSRARWAEVRWSALLIAALSWSLPMWASLIQSPQAQAMPFWNCRWSAFVLVALNLAFTARIVAREPASWSPSEARALGAAPAGAALFALLGLSFEAWLALAPASPSHLQACFALAMLWATFAGAMLWLPMARREPSLRALSLWAGAGAVSMLLLASALSANSNWTPLLNWRLAAFGVVLAALLCAVRSWCEDEETPTDTAAAAILGGGALLLCGASQEIYESARFYRAAIGQFWPGAAWMLISMAWHIGALAWLREGCARRHASLRNASFALGAAAGAVLLIAASWACRMDWAPLLNVRFGAFVVAGASAATGALMLSRTVQVLEVQVLEGEAARREARAWALRLGLWAAALMWWGLTREAYESAWVWRGGGDGWERSAQMAISLVWSLLGAAWLGAGIRFQVRELRLVALALLGLTVVKLFGSDLGSLQGGARILSLGGVGLALIFISWLYSRFAGDAQDARPVDDRGSG